MFFQVIMMLDKIGQVHIQKNLLIMFSQLQKNNINTWVTVKANVKEDFKKLHEIRCYRNFMV